MRFIWGTDTMWLTASAVHWRQVTCVSGRAVPSVSQSGSTLHSSIYGFKIPRWWLEKRLQVDFSRVYLYSLIFPHVIIFPNCIEIFTIEEISFESKFISVTWTDEFVFRDWGLTGSIISAHTLSYTHSATHTQLHTLTLFNSVQTKCDLHLCILSLFCLFFLCVCVCVSRCHSHTVKLIFLLSVS